MPRESPDSVESQILEFLMTKYPVTVDDIQRELNLNPSIVKLAVQRLASQGLVELDILPDTTYVRLVVYVKGRSIDAGVDEDGNLTKKGGGSDPGYG